MCERTLCAVWLGLFLAGIGFAGRAEGQLSSASLSSDVTVELDGLVFADEDVAVDNLMGITVPSSLGTLPESAEVTAYDLLSNGDQFFALDTTSELAGPLVVQPRDVVRYDGVAYTLEFDGSAGGIPENAAVDAVSDTGGSDLLLSFDTTVDLGGGLVAADEDLVQWNGASFSLVFDGSAEGIEGRLDLDGAHDAGGGVLGLSFDASGSVGGVDFADEDVLLFDAGGPTWTLVYDGSVQHPALAAADVEAIELPEPGQLLMLGSGLALLLGLGRRRIRP